MATLIPVRLVGDELLAMLNTIRSVTIYDAEVPDIPPADENTKRVLPYAVLWPPGMQYWSQRLCDNPDTRAGDFTVTCVGGWRPDCLAVADKVRRVLLHRRLSSGEVIVEPFDAGPSQLDTDTLPPRHFLPLPFRITT